MNINKDSNGNTLLQRISNIEGLIPEGYVLPKDPSDLRGLILAGRMDDDEVCLIQIHSAEIIGKDDRLRIYTKNSVFMDMFIMDDNDVALTMPRTTLVETEERRVLKNLTVLKPHEPFLDGAVMIA